MKEKVYEIAFKVIKKTIEELDESIDKYFRLRVTDFCKETGFGYSGGMGCCGVSFLKDGDNELGYFEDYEIKNSSRRIEELEEELADMMTGSKEVMEQYDDFPDTMRKLKLEIEIVKKFYPIMKEAEEIEDSMNTEYLLSNIGLDINPVK